MTDQPHLLDPGPAGARPDKRREGEKYYTPESATQSLLRRCPELRGGELLDPCCGDGRMAQALAERFRRVRLNDLDGAALAEARRRLLDSGADLYAAHQRDAADPLLYVPAPDAVATNPPFMHAGVIAHQALQRARRVVALLVRSTWLEPCAASTRAPRGERRWLVKCPPTRIIVLGRISFTGGGSDSAGYVWAIWLREDPQGPWQRGSIEIEGYDGAQLALTGDDHAP